LNEIIVLKNGRTLLSAFGREIKCSCLVRNELGTGNMARLPNQVVHTEPTPGYPYQPRPFPISTWDIGKPVRMTADSGAYIRLWWIPTTAHQEVRVWNVEEHESYSVYNGPSEPALYVQDSGYGIHCSGSPTTLGCLRISQDGDLEFLAVSIIDLQAKGDTAQIEVIA